MRLFKNLIAVMLSIILISLFAIDVAAAIHSIYFSLAHIHMTRMEAIFAPENHICLKFVFLGATYLVYKLLQVVVEE